MKYLIALILLIISTFSFGQKNNYEVFNLTNQVSIKHRGSIDWIIAKKGIIYQGVIPLLVLLYKILLKSEVKLL